MKHNRLLGIDYGERRIGIAVGYTEMNMAFPRETIDTLKINNIPEYIKNIVTEENIDAIVIGYPERTDGIYNEKLNDIDEFIKLIEKKCSVPVYKQNEAFSSKDAKEKTSHYSTKKKKKNKQKIDAAAAAIILKDFINGCTLTTF